MEYPSEHIELIYSIRPFSFKIIFSVKIEGETISLNDHCKAF